MGPLSVVSSLLLLQSVIHESKGSACQVNTTEEAGKCASPVETHTMCAEYAIRIYEQVWTNTTRILSIELSSEPAELNNSGTAEHNGSSSGSALGNGDDSSSGSAGSVVDEAVLDNVELTAANDAEDFEIEYLSTPSPASTKEVSEAEAPSACIVTITLICLISRRVAHSNMLELQLFTVFMGDIATHDAIFESKTEEKKKQRAISAPMPAQRVRGFLRLLLPNALLWLLVWSASSTIVAVDIDLGIGGGWTRVDIAEDTPARIENALKKESNYRESVETRVCVFPIEKLYRQALAAGTKFQYHSLACQVHGVADAGKCTKPLAAYPNCGNEIDVGFAGGWHRIGQMQDALARIDNALRREKSYAGTITKRVCVFSIDAIYQQDNRDSVPTFVYQGLACRVDDVLDAGKCTQPIAAYPTCAKYEIWVHENAATHAQQVLSIALSTGGPPGSDASGADTFVGVSPD
ncbi:hypothetical protein FI667_g3593, partial [Globisporangium splendens]